MKFIEKNKKVFSAALLGFLIIGGLAAILALSWPLLGLAALKFVDGTPDAPSLLDDIVKMLIGLLSVVPIALILGSISSFIYSFIEAESKFYMRVFSAILLIIFVVFTYQYFK